MTAAPMPQVTVLVAWQNGPLDKDLISGMVAGAPAANSWTVMTECGTYPAIVSEVKCSRGRQHELQSFEPATASFRFDNSDGRFNPWNTASVWAAWVKPGRLVRVQARWNLIPRAWSDADYGGAWSSPVPGFETASPIQGTRSFTITLLSGSGGYSSFIDGSIPISTERFAVDRRRTYSASVRARSSVVGATLEIGFYWYTATGAFHSATRGAAASLPTTGDVTASYSNVVPPTGAFFGEPFLYWVRPGPSTLTFDCVGAWPVGTLPTWAAGAANPDRFTGHIHRFPIEWPDRRSSWVEAEAADVFRVLHSTNLPDTAYDLEVQNYNPVHLWSLSEATGATAADSGSSPLPGSYVAGALLGQPPIGAGASAASLGMALTPTAAIDLGPVIPETANFTVEFAVDGVTGAGDPILLSVASATSLSGFDLIQATGGGAVHLNVFNDAGTQLNLVGGFISNGRTHHVAVMRTSATGWRLVVDGSAVSGTLAGPTTIRGPLKAGGARVTVAASPGRMANLATYNSDIGQGGAYVHSQALRGLAWSGETARMQSARILGWVGLNYDLDTTCVSTMQPATSLGGTAMAYLRRLEQAEAGALFVSPSGTVTLLSRYTIFDRAYDTPTPTFGDLPGEVPFQPGGEMGIGDEDVTNVATVSRTNGLAYRAVDLASEAAYGSRSRDITDLPLLTDKEIVDRAHFELATYAEPQFLVRNLNVWPLEAVGMIETLLGLDLLQLVGISRSDIPGTALDQPSLLERLDETFTSTGWRISIAVSPHQAEQIWILDVSQLDVNTRLGF